MDTINISQMLDQPVAGYALPLGLLILLLAFLVLGRKSLAQGWLNLRTRMRLNHLGYGHLTKLHCPDGLGYHFVIDRLVLRHDGISLLMYINYPGKIFCADDIDDWTQMLGRKSYRFKNPFYELECQVKAVADCVPGVTVDGYLFFDHQALFPKGHPERVIYLRNIPQRLERDKQFKVNQVVKSAWEKLKAMPRG
jgi:Nuclease-related domain